MFPQLYIIGLSTGIDQWIFGLSTKSFITGNNPKSYRAKLDEQNYEEAPQILSQ
jgi:hypothetical protein